MHHAEMQSYCAFVCCAMCVTYKLKYTKDTLCQPIVIAYTFMHHAAIQSYIPFVCCAMYVI